MTHTRSLRQLTIGRAAVGANALGALAVGAFALGALAIGSLVVGRMTVGKAILKSVSIGDLTIARLQVRELTVTDSLTTPACESAGSSPKPAPNERSCQSSQSASLVRQKSCNTLLKDFAGQADRNRLGYC